MATYKQYKGSPDVFDENGVWQSATPQGAQVQQVDALRPDIKVEADFARLSQKNIGAAPTPQPPKPSPVVSTDQLRQTQAESAKPYIKSATSPEVYDKATKEWISPEKAQEIQKSNPNFWKDIQIQNSPLGSEYSTTPSPIRDIQSVFGANWKPAPAFNDPKLKELGIVGAVRIAGTNNVFTLGSGAPALESPDSYKAKFGTLSQEGIVGEIDYNTALKLGITIDSDTLLDPFKDVDGDPLKEPSADMSTEDKIKAAEGFKKSAEKSAGVTDIKTERDDAYKAVIKAIEDFNTNKTTAKDKESKRLGLEAKDKAIVDASNTYTTALNSYTKAIDLERYKLAPMDIILGKQARLRSQQAIEMAPLAAAIQIAQGSYDRAKGLLDEWSEDYNTNFEFMLKDSQMNIDKIQGDLTEAQQTAKDEAQLKLDLWTADFEAVKATQESVKEIMLKYPQAGISINDSYETALKKVSPYIKTQQEADDLKADLQNDLLRAQIGSENRKQDTGANKQLSDALVNKYNLPTNTTEEQYNAILQAANIAKAETAGQPYWIAWGKTADYINANPGMNATDWDTFLRLTFNPEAREG